MMKSNNFGLSQIEFEELVEALRKGDESIFEKIFLSQFSNAIKHVRIKYSASNEEAYDMTMDALIKIRKLLIEGKLKYGNLKHLFNRMAGQNYLKLKNRGKKIVLQDTLPEVAIEPADLNEEEMNKLNKAWELLGKECGFILKQYYYNNIKLYEIATMLNKTAASVRKSKTRCVDKLRVSFNTLA